MAAISEQHAHGAPPPVGRCFAVGEEDGRSCDCSARWLFGLLDRFFFVGIWPPGSSCATLASHRLTPCALEGKGRNWARNGYSEARARANELSYQIRRGSGESAGGNRSIVRSSAERCVNRRGYGRGNKGLRGGSGSYAHRQARPRSRRRGLHFEGLTQHCCGWRPGAFERCFRCVVALYAH